MTLLAGWVAPVALALVALFAARPWTVLPVSIIGGTAVTTATGHAGVTAVVAVHGALLALGVLGLALRFAVIPRAPRRRRTASDARMLMLGVTVALLAAYGLAAGNRLHPMLVAAYQLAVVPAYFWLATATLSSPRARQRAGGAFLAGATALAAAGMAVPGRHGGLLSALALVPVLAAAGGEWRQARRALLFAVALVLGVDVLLAGYRAVWLSTAVAVLVLVLRGTPRERRAVAVALGLLAAGGVVMLGAGAAPARLTAVDRALHSSTGYRLPEAHIGLEMFLSAPLAGRGLGAVTPDVYLPGFRLTDVGPVFHVFYVTVLANGGLVLLAALLAALIPALGALWAPRPDAALPWAALLAGALASAAFAAPTDGHWELGLLAALVVLSRQPAALPVRRTAGARRPAQSPSRRCPAVATARPAAPAPEAPAPVAAIIVTYHSAGEIERCLRALDGTVDEIVVVDNASTDSTVAVVRALALPSVRVVANQRNVGFATAVNQGAALTGADTILLVNPDCVVAPGAPQALHEHLARNAEAGIAAPRVEDPDGRPAISVHPFETLRSVVASRFGGHLVPPRVRHLLSSGRRRRAYAACRAVAGAGPVVDVDWASGACLAVRGSLFRALGGLDERYFMYYEDEDLCLRAWRSGAAVRYLPHVAVRHVGGASSSDPLATWPALYRSMLRFFADHRPGSVGALRVVLVTRAGVGIAMAAGRGRGRSARAWAAVGRTALAAAPRHAEAVRS
jgi:N-acetylglucosaminyl-diphospho-decaprenol L-rhamnosyltransferase